MKVLKLYAKFYKKLKAMEEILKDIHPLALRELKKYPDGKADFDGVEFHLTRKVEKKYADEVETELKELRNKTNVLKLKAEEEGKVRFTERETFDAQIPRSSKDEVLGCVVEYKKHFGV